MPVLLANTNLGPSVMGMASLIAKPVLLVPMEDPLTLVLLDTSNLAKPVTALPLPTLKLAHSVVVAVPLILVLLGTESPVPSAMVSPVRIPKPVLPVATVERITSVILDSTRVEAIV